MKLLLLLLLLPSLCFAKDIEYFKYKFSIPENYSIYDGEPAVKGSNMIFIINKNKKSAGTVELVDRNNKNFFSLNDYGAQNYRDLFYVIFTDKPSNNQAVKELREFDSKYDLQKFEISEQNGFAFFKSTNPMNIVGEIKVLVSSPINDEVLDISFSNDEKLMNSVINSLRVK